MNYIVRVTRNTNSGIPDTKDKLLEYDWEFIEAIKEDSLYIINNHIAKLSLPLINNAFFFRENNFDLIYREDNMNIIYLISDKELAFKQKIRNNKLTNILYDSPGD